MLVSENINLFNHSARMLQTDGPTYRQDYYDNTALFTNVHRAVVKNVARLSESIA